MWIVSNKGFLSVVANRDIAGHYLIRARNKEAFDSFFGHKDIVEMRNSDYRFRVFANKDELFAFMEYIANKIDYDNFKNSIKDSEVKKMAGSIWSSSYSFQTKRYGNQTQDDWYSTYRRSNTRITRDYSYTNLFADDEDETDDDELETLATFAGEVDNIVLGDEDMGQFEELYGMPLDEFLDGPDPADDPMYDENDYEELQK